MGLSGPLVLGDNGLYVGVGREREEAEGPAPTSPFSSVDFGAGVTEAVKETGP